MVEKLEASLQARGWTQSSFEKVAMLSENRISKWKNDQGEPTARQALRMARLLDMPVEYLIDDDQDDPPPASMGERERQVWEVVRTIGAEEAWRRLVGATGPVHAQGIVPDPGAAPGQRRGAG